MPPYRLTRDSARAAGACYTDARVAELVPPDGLSPAELARTISRVAALRDGGAR